MKAEKRGNKEKRGEEKVNWESRGKIVMERLF